MAAVVTAIEAIRAAGTTSGDTFTFPTIVSKQRNSTKDTFWTIKVQLVNKADKGMKIEAEYFKAADSIPLGAKAIITVESMLEGGKVRDIVPTIVAAGKNIGKANETNVLMQALINANGIYTKKKRAISIEADDGSTKDIISILYPPMLATDLKQIKKGINYKDNRVYIDPKLNGVRFISFAMSEDGAAKYTSSMDKYEEGEIILYSRDRKLYHGLDYIREELAAVFAAAKWNFGDFYIDGEVYKHGASLQVISGIVRRFLNESKRAAESTKLEYHIFDCFFPAEPLLTYEERRARLDEVLSTSVIAAAKYKYLRRVPSIIVKDSAEVEVIHRKNLDAGYEGSMVRYGGDIYEYSNNKYHSRLLIKLKPFFEEEYEIVDFSSGEKGKAAASLMLKMKTSDGLEFNVTPMGTIEERERLYKKFCSDPAYFKKHYLGKKLTVRFDELSNDGIPVRARAIAIRDYE